VEFTYHLAEQLYIDSISSRLTHLERFIRKALMEEIVQCGGPVNQAAVERLAARYEVDAHAIVSSLIDKSAAVKGSDGQIAFVYPVSAHPTPHSVRLQDGRTLHAMCAVDSLGTSFAFGQDVTVTSVCSQCQTPVIAVVRNGAMSELQPASAHVLHVDLNKIENWATTC